MIEIESPVVLRQARLSDALDLAELRFASLVEMALLPQPERGEFVPKAAREIFTLMREERLAAWLLVHEGSVAGCACVVLWNRLPYAKTSMHAEISGVYVVPALRRRGYASELAREALATARGWGVRKIVLSSSPRAREMYRRLGFADETQMVMRLS